MQSCNISSSVTAKIPESPPHSTTSTASINQSNTAARAVLKQPCLTGGRTDTVRPKQEPTGLSDPPAGALVGQCLSDHRSNTAVQAPLELPCLTG
ncbi:hypothetical protein PCANC_08541 [Puccinia coronata f. sp. avenae]|uniref:Uncharacterized protein n=1 Tax=Puccinia coronata f. sp. avenae TaxID=200324 RepID=A0A2N5V996_9BASI|nr:hypothetical protein PCANC_08541 [Puccinia coronata f. sp. avenae]